MGTKATRAKAKYNSENYVQLNIRIRLGLLEKIKAVKSKMGGISYSKLIDRGLDALVEIERCKEENERLKKEMERNQEVKDLVEKHGEDTRILYQKEVKISAYFSTKKPESGAAQAHRDFSVVLGKMLGYHPDKVQQDIEEAIHRRGG